MSYLSEIERRHAERASVITESRKIKPPVLTDNESVKDHLKLIKEQQGQLIDKCFLVDRDVQILLTALRDATVQSREIAEECVKHAWESTKLSEEEAKVMWRREEEDAALREKDAKARGEVKGQLKCVKDDGTVAEAASAVTTKKLKEGT